MLSTNHYHHHHHFHYQFICLTGIIADRLYLVCVIVFFASICFIKLSLTINKQSVEIFTRLWILVNNKVALIV